MFCTCIKYLYEETGPGNIKQSTSSSRLFFDFCSIMKERKLLSVFCGIHWHKYGFSFYSKMGIQSYISYQTLLWKELDNLFAGTSRLVIMIRAAAVGTIG